MNNKQILKLLNKCNAFALKHNDDRFKVAISINGELVGLNLHDSEVFGGCADVGSDEYYCLVNLNSDYYDPWAKAEKQLALIHKYIQDNK